MIFFHLCVWTASEVLLYLCAVTLFCKKIQRRSPVFAAYVATDSVLLLLADVVSSAVGRHLISINLFQWIAVAATGITAVLEIGVLYELANDLVLSRTSLSSTVRALMHWTAAILLLAAAGTAAFLGKPGLERVMATFQALDFSSSVVALGLLVVLLVFSRALQISWRSLPAGIALGLAVNGCTEIATSALFSLATRVQRTEVDSLRLIGFGACVVIWLVYILLPDEQARYSGERLGLDEMKNWDEQMQKIRR